MQIFQNAELGNGVLLQIILLGVKNAAIFKINESANRKTGLKLPKNDFRF